jgi:hypothetical protein
MKDACDKRRHFSRHIKLPDAFYQTTINPSGRTFPKCPPASSLTTYWPSSPPSPARGRQRTPRPPPTPSTSGLCRRASPRGPRRSRWTRTSRSPHRAPAAARPPWRRRSGGTGGSCSRRGRATRAGRAEGTTSPSSPSSWPPPTRRYGPPGRRFTFQCVCLSGSPRGVSNCSAFLWPAVGAGGGRELHHLRGVARRRELRRGRSDYRGAPEFPLTTSPSMVSV